MAQDDATLFLDDIDTPSFLRGFSLLIGHLVESRANEFRRFEDLRLWSKGNVLSIDSALKTASCAEGMEKGIH